TGTERGIAYHRFLELCDFSVKDKQGIAQEKESFLKAGLISDEQYNLLDVDTLTQILNIPVFSKLHGATLYREKEFLCRLPANEILDTTASDYVLLQGAIDLLAKTDEGYKIIDYKYSHKSAEQLIETYSKQLALYKKAVALITKTDAGKIETIIVNIFRKEQINL
ncbi:MAG: PD-(D/E)XK nuclease family protein, partial [Clostridia bacterium]|nr:PD-(D/E)XK nuclease family protein [Clostridia bacterium]